MCGAVSAVMTGKLKMSDMGLAMQLQSKLEKLGARNTADLMRIVLTG